MRIYDTATRQKVDLASRTPGEVAVYNCGLTVYDDAHVGHARNALVFDVLRRYLRWRGIRVRYVVNFTDIDDKIIGRASQLGVSAQEVAERSIASVHRDMARLGIEAADVAPRATQHVPEMLEMIRTLVENGHAYAAGGDVYFSVGSYPAYGALSGRRLDELLAGARVEPGEHKRDPMDFALWKRAKPGEPSWESSWGPGRPGWHIECSAMSERYLGRGFDIHGGGADLIFPHHENEKAQSEAAHADGVPFCRFWMHNGYVNLGGEKMSKSTGNFVTLGQLLDRYPAAAVRLLALQTHYRKDIDFAPELVEEAAAAWRRLSGAHRRLAEVATGAEPKPREPVVRDAFIEAMEDDLNTAEALAQVFQLVKVANVALENGPEPAEAAALLAELEELAAVLGLHFGDSGAADAELVDGLVALVLELRAAARERKDWRAADRVRDRLSELGIFVEDSTSATTWHRSD